MSEKTTNAFDVARNHLTRARGKGEIIGESAKVVADRRQRYIDSVEKMDQNQIEAAIKNIETRLTKILKRKKIGGGSELQWKLIILQNFKE